MDWAHVLVSMMANFQLTRDWEATEWRSFSIDCCLCCGMRTGYDAACFLKSRLWRSSGRKDRGGEGEREREALEACPCEFKRAKTGDETDSHLSQQQMKIISLQNACLSFHCHFAFLKITTQRGEMNGGQDGKAVLFYCTGQKQWEIKILKLSLITC